MARRIDVRQDADKMDVCQAMRRAARPRGGGGFAGVAGAGGALGPSFRLVDCAIAYMRAARDARREADGQADGGREGGDARCGPCRGVCKRGGRDGAGWRGHESGGRVSE